MGMWDKKPWDNDSAADWYGGLMDSCKIRKAWLKGVRSDVDDDPDVVRAAVGLYIMLGRVYIWPIDHLDADLELAISQCEKLLDVPEYQEYESLHKLIGEELEELKSRRKGGEPPKPTEKPWWKFW